MKPLIKYKILLPLVTDAKYLILYFETFTGDSSIRIYYLTLNFFAFCVYEVTDNIFSFKKFSTRAVCIRNYSENSLKVFLNIFI